MATSGHVDVIDIGEKMSIAFADLQNILRTIGVNRNFNDIE